MKYILYYLKSVLMCVYNFKQMEKNQLLLDLGRGKILQKNVFRLNLGGFLYNWRFTFLLELK